MIRLSGLRAVGLCARLGIAVCWLLDALIKRSISDIAVDAIISSSIKLMIERRIGVNFNTLNFFYSSLFTDKEDVEYLGKRHDQHFAFKLNETTIFLN